MCELFYSSKSVWKGIKGLVTKAHVFFSMLSLLKEYPKTRFIAKQNFMPSSDSLKCHKIFFFSWDSCNFSLTNFFLFYSKQVHISSGLFIGTWLFLCSLFEAFLAWQATASQILSWPWLDSKKKMVLQIDLQTFFQITKKIDCCGSFEVFWSTITKNNDFVESLKHTFPHHFCISFFVLLFGATKWW